MNYRNGNEWFEILDLKSNKHVFVNSLSGKCQWNQPHKFQKLTEDQWWQLYDFKSNHFYYYHRQSKKKTWIKPDSMNIVSLVKFQILKDKKTKTFVDKITQTNADISLTGTIKGSTIGKESEYNDMSLDYTQSSGYSTSKSNNVTSIPSINITTHGADTDKADLNSVSSIGVRKPIPRTNPNYDRKNSTTYRLSQPIIGTHNDLNWEDVSIDGPIDSSSLTNINVNTLSAESLGSQNSRDYTHVDSFRSNNFPRESVLNAIGLSVPTNNEIWSKNLFNKSGDQLAGIMSWTKKSIQDSLLSATPKGYRKDSCKNFKQIQMYMGDRETQMDKELIALTICRRGILSPQWANEIFMQLCKQVTHNPKTETTYNGWDLICVCLMFFHPDSMEMKNSFRSFINQYACFEQKIDVDQLTETDFVFKSIRCARISLKLLEKSRKVAEITAEDVMEAMNSYFSSTIFFSSLDEVIDVQKRFYPNRKLPWIQVALTREIIRCNGAQTQGILRIPSEINKIEALSEAIEKAFKRDSVIEIDFKSSLNDCDPLLQKILDDLKFEHDPLLLSSVLKYWFRHLRIPLIPFDEKTESMASIANDFTKLEMKLKTLPEVNFYVVKYLIYFLQVLAKEENVAFTSMSAESLVTLMAPTLFLLDINQLQPAMYLLQTLIVHLDTSDVQDMV